jgi:ABC-type microcin C transport system permease subunit YejB
VRTYLAKRLLLIVPTLFGVAAVEFLIMRVIPGDVTLLILGGDQTGRIDPQQLAAMRHQLGLDQPLAVQFGTWLWGVLRLDFGTSLWTGQPVIDEVLIRLPLSLEVAILATIVSVLLAIPLGMIAAVRQDTWVDYLIRIVSIGGQAIPSFWVGILVILALVIYFGWGPPLEFTPPWVDPWANFQQLVWPVLTVGYRYAAVTTRMTRSTVLEVLREDYNRVGQGPPGTRGSDPSRAQERDAAGDHPGRHRVRVPDRRPRGDRDRLHPERGGAVRGRRGRAPRLPGGAGPRLPDRALLRGGQSPDRPHLRVARPAHPVPLR